MPAENETAEPKKRRDFVCPRCGTWNAPFTYQPSRVDIGIGTILQFTIFCAAPREASKHFIGVGGTGAMKIPTDRSDAGTCGHLINAQVVEFVPLQMPGGHA
jgi:hypothetical protein